MRVARIFMSDMTFVDYALHDNVPFPVLLMDLRDKHGYFDGSTFIPYHAITRVSLVDPVAGVLAEAQGATKQ